MRDDELKKINFGKLMNGEYRLPSSKITETVDGAITKTETKVVDLVDKQRQKRPKTILQKIADTIFNMIVMVLAIPFMTFAGIMLGIATVVEMLIDTWNMWIKK